MKNAKWLSLSALMLIMGLAVAWALGNGLNTVSVHHRGVVVFVSTHTRLACLISFAVVSVILEIIRRVALHFASQTDSMGVYAANAILWPAGLFVVCVMMDYQFQIVAHIATRAAMIVCVLWLFDAVRVIRRARSQKEYSKASEGVSVGEEAVITDKTGFAEVLDGNSSKMAVEEDLTKGLLSNTQERYSLHDVAELYLLETKILFGKYKNAKIRVLKEVNLMMSICIVSALYLQKKTFSPGSYQVLHDRYLEMMKLYLFENDFVEDAILNQSESILQTVLSSESKENLPVADSISLGILSVLNHADKEAETISNLTFEFVDRCTKKLQELNS